MENDPSNAAKGRAMLLATLDRGRYADALATVEVDAGESDNVDRLLLSAEVALYLDRFDELPALFEQLRDVDLWLDADDETGRHARRARALMVETACFTGDQAQAEQLLRPLLTGAIRANDELAELRAIYDAGRIARHKAEWDLAIDRFERGLELARRLGNRFYEGRLLYALGHARYIQNDVEAALPLLQSSVRLLRETEDLRFRATVESFLGCLLSDLGDGKTALALVDSAEETAGRLGILGDMVTARMNAARTRLALGRYEEAERALTDLLEWERRPETTPIELSTLRLLAIVQCVRGRVPDARRSATEALRLAEIAGNDDDRLEARLLVERVRTLAADEDAGPNALRELANEADASGTPYVQAEARIYLARALLASDPTQSQSALRRGASASGARSIRVAPTRARSRGG